MQSEALLKVTAAHKGRRILCRERGKFFAGEIVEVSRSGLAFRLAGGRWVENKPMHLVELLEALPKAPEKPKRAVVK